VPASVTISNENAQTATLTVHTTAASALNEPLRPLWPASAGAALACILFLVLPTRRRGWLTMLAWVGLFAAVAGIGCSGGAATGGGVGGQKDPGTTAGRYTVTISGDSGIVTETGTVALTVQ
jgi:hypothetical protein